MKTVAVHNLGCKVNSYELDVIEQELTASGYTLVPFDTVADVYVINTCTVTNIADRKSRQMIHRARKLNPSAVVVALGCYVETSADKVSTDASIDIAIGNNRKKELVAILDNYFRGHSSHSLTFYDDSIKVDSREKTSYEEMKLKAAPEHTRAFIKIQDGCNQFCSYCLIPYARGRIRSRQQADIMEEIIGLAANGVKEVVLTGIHISSYGLDRGEPELVSLLKKVHAVKGIERIRLGSLEPRIVTRENAAAFASMPKLCPHFHLSLQSGCAETLKRMNRHYSPEEYMEGVNALREVYEAPAITTDVIVGFPGESEEEFQESMDFCRNVDFYEMHVFKYSVRKGTAAEKLGDKLTDAKKSARSDLLIDMTCKQSKAYREYFIGREIDVLFEECEEYDGQLYICGYTDRYVKCALKVDSKAEGESLSGEILRCKGSAFLNDELMMVEAVK